MTQAYSLSSDILEHQFGPSELTVLHQSGSRRFVVIRGPQQEVLELARTDFVSEGAQRFAATHAQIMAGKAMGKAFRDDGLKLIRVIRFIDHWLLPKTLDRYFSTTEPATVMLVDMYVGDSTAHYARTLEVYNPKVDWGPYWPAGITNHAADKALAGRLLATFAPAS